jgi:hypothetical protein
MAHLLHSQPQRQRRKRSGVGALRVSGHARPVNDNCKPTVSFQYLQLIPMTAIFLVMIALVVLVAIML